MASAKNENIFTPEDLRKYRTIFKLSQQDLAEYSGFRSYNTILKYETGKIEMMKIVQLGYLKLFELLEKAEKKKGNKGNNV